MLKNLLLISLYLAMGLSIPSAIAQNITWSEHIAPILYTNCTSCHHEGSIAPFSLMSYDNAAAFAPSIATAVAEGHMPPWNADHHYAHYADERVLCDDEKALIAAWINNGTPQGDPLLAPPPPVYSNGSALGTPDLTLTSPLYTVPNTNGDLYRCFAIPTGLIQNKYITAMEIVPGNREIVHHVLVFYDTSGDCIANDNADGTPGYTCFGVACNSATLIGTWAPGASPFILPTGMGISMPANGHIVLQVHYPAGSQGQSDQTTLNLKLSPPAGLRNVSLNAPLNYFDLDEGMLVIPANTVRTFHANYTVPVNMTILDVAPHMHLIGTSLRSYAVTPSNDTIRFIDIPHWDFHWQTQYRFKKAIKIPAGTTLYAVATYDNTANNEHNPNNPPQNVTAGEETTDEMMLVFFSYLTYQNGDENIILDNNTDNHTCDAKLQAKLWLDGVFNGTQMTTSLANSNLLPRSQPFSTMPWNYFGTERVASTVSLNNNATEWVLAELHTSSDSNQDILLTQRPALLYKDGTLHDIDGSLGLSFFARDNMPYYIAIRPRSHLSILSSQSINLPNSIPYDFTTASNKAFGNNQLKNLGNNQFGLYAGDNNADGIISYTDYNVWKNAGTLTNTYHQADVNKDKNVNATDFDLLRPNIQLLGLPNLRY